MNDYPGHEEREYDEWEDEEEVDEVVAEFDVCLAGSLREQLQLLQYPLRPSYRQYGDQGRLKDVQVAVETRTIAGQDGTVKAAAAQAGGEDAADLAVSREATNLKLVYELDRDSQNYDANAVEHRVQEHCLKTELVDTCGSATDSTFASIEVAVQPNYAVGVFKD